MLRLQCSDSRTHKMFRTFTRNPRVPYRFAHEASDHAIALNLSRIS